MNKFMKKFKPCPYCGEGEELEEDEFFVSLVAVGERADYSDHRVGCSNCGALGPWADTRAGAIDAWNKREEKEASGE